MHEVGLMQAALEIALEHAARQGATRVHRITLRVGPLAGVDPDAMRFAFGVVAHGTIAEGARLEVEHVPVVCFCPGCEQKFKSAGWFFECPRCGQATDQVRQGGELEVASLEVS